MGTACSWSRETEVPVMTATNYGGDLSLTIDEPANYSTCNDWTATDAGGGFGYADSAEFGHWTSGCNDQSPNACANTAALYCFQQ